MTVFATYEPVYADITDEQSYNFPYEAVGADAIEVYEACDVLAIRKRVAHSDYVIDFHGGERTPTKEAATIRFSREHTPGTTRVVIERNTLIDQTTDLPFVHSFNTRMLEFTLDKLTMICQEMVQRKCTAVSATPITQEITFGSYRTLEDGAVTFALDKLSTIINEISGTAEDCRTTPEDA